MSSFIYLYKLRRTKCCSKNSWHRQLMQLLTITTTIITNLNKRIFTYQCPIIIMTTIFKSSIERNMKLKRYNWHLMLTSFKTKAWWFSLAIYLFVRHVKLMLNSFVRLVPNFEGILIIKLKLFKSTFICFQLNIRYFEKSFLTLVT